MKNKEVAHALLENAIAYYHKKDLLAPCRLEIVMANVLEAEQLLRDPEQENIIYSEDDFK